MKRHIPVLAFVILAGCVSTGTKFQIENVGRLTPGMSLGEVADILGRPQMVVRDPEGTQRQEWSYASGSILRASARAVSLSFDSSGKLLKVPKIAPAN